MDKNKYIVGIDGGGTKMKLKAVYANELLSVQPHNAERPFPAEALCSVIGESEAGGSNLTAESEEQVRENLKELFRKLFTRYGLDPEDCVCACLGTAGAMGGARAQTLTGFLSEILPSARIPAHTHIIVTSDIYTSLYGGTLSQSGLVLNSGTGSFCYGRNASDESCRSGGWGHIISDEGSGYYIGQRVLNIVTKSTDGRGKPTAMAKMVFDKVGGITNQSIVDYVYGGKYTKKDIASFAVICEKAFDLGDESAKKIVSDAAGELFAMLEAVVRELKMCDMAVSCVYTGSILTRFAGVRNIVADLIKKSFPGISFEPCREDAAWGAVLMCLEWMKKKEVM